MIASKASRIVAAGTVALLVVGVNPPAALAGVRTSNVVHYMVPGDGPPGPEQAMRQAGRCRSAGRIAAAVTLPAPGYDMLNIAQAWRHSTGNRVQVAVIDSGVNPVLGCAWSRAGTTFRAAMD